MRSYGIRKDGKGYRYFTNLSFLILTLNFVSKFALSWMRRPWTNDGRGEFNRWTEAPATRLLVQVTWVVAEVIYVCAVLLDIIYWGLLYNGQAMSPADSFLNASVHGTNALLVIVELVLMRQSFVAIHVLFLLLYALAYTIFALIWHSTTAEWIYPFLDLSRTSNAAVSAP